MCLEKELGAVGFWECMGAHKGIRTENRRVIICTELHDSKVGLCLKKKILAFETFERCKKNIRRFEDCECSKSKRNACL